MISTIYRVQIQTALTAVQWQNFLEFPDVETAGLCASKLFHECSVPKVRILELTTKVRNCWGEDEPLAEEASKKCHY
jgi:hypothetical protein